MLVKHKQKILVIVGPTSSGKSDLAVELALEFNGEVISADSRQVYKGLDIASGKITKEEMIGIPHHLLSIADPSKEVFTVSDFVEHAGNAIRDIVNRGKLPIIAGGTMFYIDALLGNTNIPEVPPNPKLRQKLEQRGEASLFEELMLKDSKRAMAIGDKNKRRLIRALEIVEELGKVPNAPVMYQTPPSTWDTLQIGIKVEREELLKRIHKRTTHRAIAGMIEEAEKLHNPPAGKGLSYEKLESLGLEYRNLAHFLQGKLTEDELLERIEINDRQYARKQMKWWIRNKKIKWFKLEDLKKIKEELTNFLKKQECDVS